MTNDEAVIGAILLAHVRRTGGSSIVSAVDEHMVRMGLPMQRHLLLVSFARVALRLHERGLLVLEGERIRLP